MPDACYQAIPLVTGHHVHTAVFVFFSRLWSCNNGVSTKTGKAFLDTGFFSGEAAVLLVDAPEKNVLLMLGCEKM